METYRTTCDRCGQPIPATRRRGAKFCSRRCREQHKTYRKRGKVQITPPNVVFPTAADASRARQERLRQGRYLSLEYKDIGCYICGTTVGPFEAEHIVPSVHFAAQAAECETEFWSGIRKACKLCNRAKGAMDLPVFLLRRLRQPLQE